ncbi:MAG: F0F1 ATP synthase subunit gamma, partial [Armatimonadetes bacterium]|nr:F0F1 ATP synthase subunit gamma [Armatimonadota bacterium]MDW8122957.1 FoF1 ATP synthase subunit gamma [Armatimonadota bacterium]
MQNLRAIRRKIRGITNLRKIMQAMKMVAAARLRRVQDRVLSGKPYTDRMRALVTRLAPHLPQAEHPLLVRRTVRRRGLVVVTGDKGLCGAYNSNIIRTAQALLSEDGQVPSELFLIGKKGYDFFTRRGYRPRYWQHQVPVTAPFPEFRSVAQKIADWFLTGEVDEVRVVYGEFVNVLIQRPKVVSLLPIAPSAGIAGEEEKTMEYIFEP